MLGTAENWHSVAGQPVDSPWPEHVHTGMAPSVCFKGTHGGAYQGGLEVSEMKRMLLLALTAALVLGTTGLAQANNPLQATTTHTFVGAPPGPDGYMLGWEGTITGDINGEIQWWFYAPTFVGYGQTSHYSVRVEIRDGTELLLVVADSGSTTVRHGKNSNWRANGVVIEAYGDYESWLGRNVHESGNFTWLFPGVPDTGVSIFRIN